MRTNGGGRGIVRAAHATLKMYQCHVVRFSVWETSNLAVLAEIKAGTVTLADLIAAGAIQHGATSDDYGTGCPDTGNGGKDFYAVSIPGVTPARFINWLQAAAACRNADKRLLANAEWQAAALGAPDGAPCTVGGLTDVPLIDLCDRPEPPCGSRVTWLSAALACTQLPHPYPCSGGRIA